MNRYSVKIKELLLYMLNKTAFNTAKLKDDIDFYYNLQELKDIHENDIET